MDTGFNGGIGQFERENITFKDFCGIALEAEDLDGHGSHMTGILLSEPSNIMLISGRVMTHVYLVAHDPMIAGIRWAIEQQADVILVAAGFSYDNKLLQQAGVEALEYDILVVAAIGNMGRAGATVGHYPARYPGVISVGSVNAKGEISDFTDQYPGLTILAPGENIKSFYLNGEMVEGSGTSQAAANVAGAVANIIEAYKAKHMPYNAKSIIKLLQRTGGSTMPSSEFKIIDQEAALKAIQED